MAGGVWLDVAPPRTTQTSINISAVGATVILANARALWKLLLITSDVVNVTILAGTTALTPALPFFGPGGSLLLPYDTEPWFTFPAGAGFVLNLSAAVQVSGMVYTT